MEVLRQLQEDPDLLAYNVNRWLQTREPSQRLLRTIDGRARAFLSNRYRRIDNFEIAMTVLPIIGEIQGARFEICQITENYMYIKVVNPKLTGEVRVGDIVQSGMVISNSETGLGAVSIQPLIYRLACLNGMVVSDAKAATRRNHVGKSSSTEENFAIYSQETRDADSKAIMLKVRASRTPENLLAELEQYGNGPLLSVCGNIRAFLQQRNLDTKGAA